MEGEFLTKHFKYWGGNSYTAIGLQLQLENGNMIPYYSDGLQVPKIVASDVIGVLWDASFPVVDAARTCVAFKNMKLQNVPCGGIYNKTPG